MESVEIVVTAPSVEDVMQMYGAPLASNPLPADPQTEVVVLATASFGDIDQMAFDAHKALVAQMSLDYGGNLWVQPTRERMPFPDACLFAVGAMINTEVYLGRKADWFLWVEDDIAVPRDLMRRLRAVADPVERPFVACAGYDRIPPHKMAVWEKHGDQIYQWIDSPHYGPKQVHATGLPAALIHRSVFERIGEPYFATTSTKLAKPGESDPKHGDKPDTYFCRRLRDNGIPIWVDSSIDIIHFGLRMPIWRKTAPILRELKPLDKITVDRESRCITDKPIASCPETNRARRVFGLGTGRCGTKSLADLLDAQPGVSVSHECGGRILPWDLDGVGLDAVLKILNTFPGAVKGDVAFYYLNYVESILQRYPDARFVCLKRDKVGCVASLVAKHDSLGINPLQPGVCEPSVWDRTMPDIDPDLDRLSSVCRYYDDYYSAAGLLVEKYPDSFRIFDTEALNTEHGVRDILDFCGVKIQNPVIGIKSNAMVNA